MSKIEWTNRTWNPVAGCSKVSEGCKNCYAMRLSYRLQHNPLMKDKYLGVATKTTGGAINFTGKINLLKDKLTEPSRWRKPALVFVNSMSDLFHENIPFHFIDAVFSVMADVDRHTYQVLTKRPARMLEFFAWKAKQFGIAWHPGPNIWLGVSVENQKVADERIPLLLKIPAAVRFLSCEPLLGPLQISAINAPDNDDAGASRIWPLEGWRTDMGRPCKTTGKINWVIAGGESGPGARPMHPDWVRSLRDQCAAASVPFFFKQWGDWIAGSDCESLGKMQRVGKKAAGHVLDGRTYQHFPLNNTL